MSLDSWKEEFYPIEAGNFEGVDYPEGVVRHSLRKWIGMRKENLAKHECARSMYGDLVSVAGSQVKQTFGISSKSCSLCVAYMGRDCSKCPLAIIRGGVACDKPASQLDEFTSPWFKWAHAGDPEPMIGYLEKALEFVRSEKGGAQ